MCVTKPCIASAVVWGSGDVVACVRASGLLERPTSFFPCDSALDPWVLGAARAQLLRSLSVQVISHGRPLTRGSFKRFSHIGSCEYIVETFGLFVSFAQRFYPTIELSLHLIFLGMRDGTTPLPSALSALRVIMWKFALVAFTRVDTDGAKYNPADVWKGALRRFETRVRRYDIYVARLSLRRRCAGDSPLDYARYRAVIAPLEGYDEDGEPLPRPVLASALASLA